MEMTQEQEKLNQEAHEGKHDLTKALIICVLLIVLIRSFIIEPFKIPSSSMFPTLRIGDYIFVSKFNYGLTIPFTKIELVSWSEPKRGEVIVFLSPRDESLHYIKRVVGVPGDKIEFKGRELWINNQLIEKVKSEDANLAGDDLYIENLGGVKHYVKYLKHASSFSKTSLTDVIPSGKYFVVGDSRDDSYDSRYWGFVPKENIKGKAQMIWLSLDHGEGWDNLLKVRWNRCGQLIR